MKWLILQSAGVHTGKDQWAPNHFLRECFAIEDALKRLGQDVIVQGLRHPGFEKISLLDEDYFNQFDIIFCLENWEEFWLPKFNILKVKALKIYWAIDVHVRGVPFYESVTEGYNIVLHSTGDFIYGFDTTSKRHIWFPNAVDDRYFNRDMYDFTKTGDDFLFIGKERPIVRNLMQQLDLKHYMISGMPMILKIGNAKIHFNHNLSNDVNYRTFETIGLGTCLVTDANTNLISLGFKNGINCITYNYYGELLNKIPIMLRDGTWKEIGNAGFELSKQHTYYQRFEKLIEELINDL